METLHNQRLPARYTLALIDLLESDYGIEQSELEPARKLCVAEASIPEGFIKLEKFAEICEIANQLCQDPFLGLRFGALMSTIRLGTLATAASTSRTVLDMFRTMEKFSDVLTPIPSKMVIESDQAVRTFSLPSYFHQQREFHSQVMVATNIRMLEESVGTLPKTMRIEFPFPPRPEYRIKLPYQLEFNMDRLAMIFPREYFKSQLVGYDPAAQKLLLAACEDLAAQLKTDASLGTSIKLLFQSCRYSFPSLEQLALSFNVSSRTLHKRLAKEKLSYRTLLLEHRIERSAELLRESELSVEEIAEQLGYSEAANFCRAFKRYKQVSPSEYRLANHS